MLDLSRTSRSASLIRVAISCVKLVSVSVKIISRASAIVMSATRSSSAFFCSSSSPICFSRSLMCLDLSVRLCSLLSNTFSLLVRFSSLRSREEARSVKRVSICFNSCLSDLNSFSISSRYFLASSFASISNSLRCDLLSRSAVFLMCSASNSA
ncbi:hypothetical protein SGADD03_01522 [Streptococcus gallolyticus]|uniref:Uncharacterized protein n=1 Tax=Streptococcus gallolyticus TaxID=315405 RepID=A0A139QV15_9STRE|nr:hypothetical protein SGADD03_01522 [Streptococcus gallolyticus]